MNTEMLQEKFVKDFSELFTSYLNEASPLEFEVDPVLFAAFSIGQAVDILSSGRTKKSKKTIEESFGMGLNINIYCVEM